MNEPAIIEVAKVAPNQVTQNLVSQCCTNCCNDFCNRLRSAFCCCFNIDCSNSDYDCDCFDCLND